MRFFPEGGDCVTGVPCRVAVVAETAGGEPRAAEKVIVRTGGGRTLTTTTTSSAGVGTFTYVPRAGESIVGIAGPRVFPVPEARPSGIHLNVVSSPGAVALNVGASGAADLVGATLLVHLRGRPVLERPVPAGRDRAAITLNTDQLPAGLFVATVFDRAGEPVAERLLFVPPSTTTDVELTADARGQVDLRLPGAGAGGRLSLAVLPVAATGGAAADDIRTWLLLQSDLDRPLAITPTDLFGATAAERAHRLDELLLTRG